MIVRWVAELSQYRTRDSHRAAVKQPEIGLAGVSRAAETQKGEESGMVGEKRGERSEGELHTIS